MTNPNHFDLELLAKAMRGDEHYVKLVNLVARLKTWYSVLSDLENAKRSVNLARGIATRQLLPGEAVTPQTIESATTGQALLTLAAVIYCRCTHSAPNSGRLKWSPAGKYNDQQKAAHRSVTEFRDKALAHFGTSLLATGNEEWYQERLIFTVTDEGSRVRFPSQKFQYTAAMLEAATLVVDAAIADAKKVRDNDERALHECIESDIARPGSTMAARLRAARFDPVKFFYNAAAAAQFETGSDDLMVAYNR